MSLQGRIGGKIKIYGGREYLELTTSLEELRHGSIPEHIRIYQTKVPPWLPHKPIYFLDIENCGLNAQSPVHTISIGKLNGGFTIRTFVALDYYGERAILQRTLECMRRSLLVFTFNGTSFDVNRLSRRFQAYGLFTKHDKASDLSALLGERHVDLYPLMREQVRKEGQTIAGQTLQTYERAFFHTHRENEVHGRDIPIIYHNFVNGAQDPEEQRDRVEQMAKIVEHNQLDVASMGAVLGFLQERGYTPWKLSPVPHILQLEQETTHRQEERRDNWPF